MSSVIKGVTSIFGGKSKVDSQKQGMQASDSLYTQGLDSLEKYYNRANETLQPYANEGINALRQLASPADVNARNTEAQNLLSALAAAMTKREAAPAGFNYQSDPGYQFTADLAQRALNQQLASRGKYFSGRAVAEGTNDLQGRLAASEYDKLYNRYINEANSALNNAQNYYTEANTNLNTGYGLNYNRLSDLLNYGANAAGNQANNAMNMGRSALGARMGQANANMTQYNNLGNAREAQWGNVGNLGSSIFDTVGQAYTSGLKSLLPILK